jgi:hypothetical protein
LALQCQLLNQKIWSLMLYMTQTYLCKMIKNQNILEILKQKNVSAEWLALLLRIREALVSNAGPEAGYPNRGFCRFPQSLQAESRRVSQAMIASFHTLYDSLFIHHPIIRGYRV